MFLEKLAHLKGILCRISEAAILIFALRILIVSHSDDESMLVFHHNGILTRL